MKVKKLFSTRRRIIATTAAGVLFVAGGGIAAAYFLSSHATGTGTGKIGTPTPGISITATTVTGTLVPGTTPQTFGFVVHDTSGKTFSTLVAVATLDTATGTTGTTVLVTNTTTAPITGCLASWFTLTYLTNVTPASTPYPFHLSTPTNPTEPLGYNLHFATTTTTTQGACGTAVPTVHVTVHKM